MMRTASDGIEFFPASDSSLLVRFTGEDLLLANQHVLALAARLQQSAVARNLHPAYNTLLIAFDPLVHSQAQLEELVRSELRAEPQAEAGRIIEVPVSYGGDFGPDLEDVARHTGLTSREVIELHSKPIYRVYFLGFAPGFPYLGGMDPRIAVPRLGSPRKEVPPGSVAIADENTGIYPVASPGGWRIIGRTPIRLFTPEVADPTLLRPGDSVRFLPITREEFAGGRAMSAFLRVLSPGLQTTVQDLGRPGYAHLGISASGCADSFSARIANRLVGNADNAALLEMTLLGGEFEFGCDSLVALAGADFSSSLEGKPHAPYVPFHVAAGKTLHCGAAKDGARCYLAVAGGLAVAPVLGSASTHVMSAVGGLQGRALRHGDLLPLQPQAHVKPSAPSIALRLQRRTTLRVTYGPQQRLFSSSALESLCSQTFSVSENSNRVGLRLHGAPIPPARERMLTEGAALGAIQIPPEGEPIILFVEHQTTGGYPKIANVIAADLPSVGQLRPRDEVRFQAVTISEALEILRKQERDLDQAVAQC